jgi:hypothetical protein
MYFDEGVRVKNTAFMSFMLRNSIRALAMALLALGLIADFQIIHSGFPLGRLSVSQYDTHSVGLSLSLTSTLISSQTDERAGTAGWWTLVNEEWVSHPYLYKRLISKTFL